MRCGVGKEKSDGNKGLNDDSPRALSPPPAISIRRSKRLYC